MSKKKNVNEGIVDKIDPKLAKSMAKVVQAKKEMESHLSKSDLSKVRRGELPDWAKKYK